MAVREMPRPSVADMTQAQGSAGLQRIV